MGSAILVDVLLPTVRFNAASVDFAPGGGGMTAGSVAEFAGYGL